MIGALCMTMTGTKKVVDCVHDLNRVPEEVLHLVRLVAALEAPLATARRLLARHETAAYVRGAIEAVAAAIAACDSVLNDVPPENTTDECDSAWRLWLAEKPKAAVHGKLRDSARVQL